MAFHSRVKSSQDNALTELGCLDVLCCNECTEVVIVAIRAGITGYVRFQKTAIYPVLISRLDGFTSLTLESIVQQIQILQVIIAQLNKVRMYVVGILKHSHKRPQDHL